MFGISAFCERTTGSRVTPLQTRAKRQHVLGVSRHFTHSKVSLPCSRAIDSTVSLCMNGGFHWNSKLMTSTYFGSASCSVRLSSCSSHLFPFEYMLQHHRPIVLYLIQLYQHRNDAKCRWLFLNQTYIKGIWSCWSVYVPHFCEIHVIVPYVKSEFVKIAQSL